jgi:RNA polymerase sigma factor (sigma-70 family)
VTVLQENYFRHEHGRLVSVLARRFGRTRSIEQCEDAVQAALLRAVETWPRDGVPDEPGAWLYRVAYRLVLDGLRAEKRLAGEVEVEKRADESDEALEALDAVDAVDVGVRLRTELPDDLLRMLFLCADPEIPIESQLVLALKTLCGFSTEEIALRLFHTSDAIHKRLQRGRAKLKERNSSLEMPPPSELERRVPSILQMLYLLFSEGYSSAKVDTVIRRELCDEAIRLARLLAEHPTVGAIAETDALLALMHFHASRFDARFDSVGGLLLLKEQDRSKWDRSLIDVGVLYLGRSARGDRLSRYHVEAAIAVEHALAPTFLATNWEEIAALYAKLEQVAPSPLNQLNRAIAIAEWKGAEAGLAVLRAADPPPWLVDFYLWDATWSELYRRTGDTRRALTHVERAIEAAPTHAEKALLDRRRLDLMSEIEKS